MTDTNNWHKRLSQPLTLEGRQKGQDAARQIYTGKHTLEESGRRAFVSWVDAWNPTLPLQVILGNLGQVRLCLFNKQVRKGFDQAREAFINALREE